MTGELSNVGFFKWCKQEVIYESGDIMKNEQQYRKLVQEIRIKEPTEERRPLLDLAERLDYTIDRINKYNNLPFF